MILARTGRNSLEYLSIFGDMEMNDVEWSEDDDDDPETRSLPSWKSLCTLNALKHLTLSWGLYQDQPSTAISRRHRKRLFQCPVKDLRPLETILPQSIETVCLTGEVTPNHISYLLDGLPGHKGVLLAKLCEVDFHGMIRWNGKEKELLLRCASFFKKTLIGGEAAEDIESRHRRVR